MTYENFKIRQMFTVALITTTVWEQYPSLYHTGAAKGKITLEQIYSWNKNFKFTLAIDNNSIDSSWSKGTAHTGLLSP